MQTKSVRLVRACRKSLVIFAISGASIGCGGGGTSAPPKEVPVVEIGLPQAGKVESARTAAQATSDERPILSDDSKGAPKKDGPHPTEPLAPVRKVTVSEAWAVETSLSDQVALYVGPTHLLLRDDTNAKRGLAVLDKKTGAELWRKPLVQAATAFENVVVAWRPLQVFEAETGKLLWKRAGSTRYVEAVAYNGQIAFISVEKNPMRYRLTVADLQTGVETLTADHPGPGFEEIERRSGLSFNATGLWVANALIPLDTNGFGSAWTAAVDAARSGSAFPCLSVSSTSRILTKHRDGTIQLWDRETPEAPQWRINVEQASSWCDVTRMHLDAERIFNQYRTFDESLETQRTTETIVGYALDDGRELWRRDDIDPSRRMMPTAFGVLLVGAPGAPGPAALDNAGKDVEVIGKIPGSSVQDNGVIFATEGFSVMRLEIQASP